MQMLAKRHAIFVVWGFLVHMLSGLGVFAIIVLVAILLRKFVELMEKHGMPQLVVSALEYVIYGIIALDIFLLSIFVLASCLAAWRGLWTRE